MSNLSVLGGLRPLEELISLEDRHRGLSFEEARHAVLTGEKDGWPIFVEKYSRFVYSVALRLLMGPENERQDRAQEIYCSVFSRIQQNDYLVLRRFQSRCKFTTYLFRMVQTARSTLLRHEIRESSRTDCVDFSDEANRGIEAAMAERASIEQTPPCFSPAKLRAGINRVIEGLSSRERLLVKFRFQKGLKLREIAETLAYRDTNDAAYALRKALQRFKPVAALEEGEWTEDEKQVVYEVFNALLFQ